MTPPSTYRVQLRPSFTFGDAEAVVDYLRELGVGALYCSPVLDAVPGSTHGYDVVDHSRARPELGGDAGLLALAGRLRAGGMGLVLDIVPNHMAVAVPSLNRWWWDVLRHGRSSEFAGYFDIDWSRGRLLVPVLGSDSLDELTTDGDELVYYEHRFPIAPGTGGGTPAQVHDRQHYELVNWRRGNAELNYRRFFDITTLAAVRVEDPAVFDATHHAVLRWVTEGHVTGLRVDHPDGLADPGGYFRRLRAAAPDAWLVVEKILAPGEPLPATWPVDGTTGYDALREICGVFVDPAGEPAFTELAHECGTETDFAALTAVARKLVTDTILVAEVRRIAGLVSGVDARTDVARTMIDFPVYRSYLPEGERYWAAAVHGAELDRQVRAGGELATRIQQTSGMVVAKGTEDTAFYRYSRFVALNEVGGAPDRFGVPVADFHAAAAARESGWPRAMTTLSTHDTKRSEDVRARLAVLAEMPDEFAAVVTRWSATHGIDEPALNLLAWQSLVGAWPITADRMREYLLKAAREAKLRTTWTDADEPFEKAVAAWPDRVNADLGGAVGEFVARISGPGWSNALGQKLVQLTAPGVPDVYQGSELWDLSLVDPDNRRPVDYGVRRSLLARMAGGWLPPVDDSGAAKLLVVHKALTLRRDEPSRFTGYRALTADGPAAEHVLAFARTGLVTVATRLPVRLTASGGWRDTVLALPAGPWTDVLTGTACPDVVALADLLARYPVALLVRGES
ncbi:MAG TPA: malto-oligosyltrehalose synthase [Pseudonocardiaceae bacterium]|nr:malto-oligosyltrehalose synthase [Pseudonocardiaceae bacterium]